MRNRNATALLTRRSALQTLLLAASGAGGTRHSVASTAISYPDGRNITVIVPFPPGGSTDLIARVLANQLSVVVGASVVVDNRPGAGGIVGTGLARRAAPDGHTLLIGSVGTLAALPHLQKDLPYQPLTDFAPISLVASVPNILAVNPAKLDVRTVEELIQAAKAKPNGFDYGSGGVGSSPHLAMEHFAFKTGAQFHHIPYKGTGPALNDLMGGITDLVFTGYPVLAPLLRAGKLRAIAVGSLKRLPAMPELPTVAETKGLEGFEVGQWYGLLAPRSTPAPVIARLNEAVLQILKSPETAKAFAQDSLEIMPSTPAAFAEYISSQSRLWRQSLAHLPKNP
ncbi:tripartite tricarboxylate transporter substrate binding protein [Hydrogenophaga sp.]|uniref:Bug family tripartite tricarboxylate transporter substrate binding protein n=1 Tax=Hydrogenophaga sp. TaxID=1904254 RepID=UPI00271942E9|nr:tripartite tricarboxylate transporter substrate binding protein [Hydrogenophaga sp.]MDO9437902.1 tripartite tricarboxylate transporter substrate binding protein [Hydrogenophaga sp.]